LVVGRLLFLLRVRRWKLTRPANWSARGPPLPNVWPTLWLALPNVCRHDEVVVEVVRFEMFSSR
jgi:hypothetical protein